MHVQASVDRASARLRRGGVGSAPTSDDASVPNAMTAAAIPALLVSTVTRWYGTARAPRALARAGFEVTLLTPRNSLAEASRYVSRIAYLPDDATPMQWIHALAATVKAASPAQVIPCDDMSFRLLAMLVNSPPPQLQPML